MRLLAAGAIAVLAAIACVFAIGSALVAPAPAAIPDTALALPHESVTFASASGSTIHGWYVPSDPSVGTVVLMHGVRANRLAMMRRAGFLHAAGYAVLLFDFQAHGESPGRHITMGYLEARDAAAAVSYVRSRSPDTFVAALGVSLGGAAAVLGDEPLRADAFILEAVYPDLGAATANRLSMRLGQAGAWLSPLLLLQLSPRLGISLHDLAPIERISRIRAPVLLIAGDRDRHTTLEDSRRLFEATPDPKELWVIPGAAHVDFAAYSGRDYDDHVLNFLSRVRGGGG